MFRHLLQLVSCAWNSASFTCLLTVATSAWSSRLGRAAPAIAALGVQQLQHVVCGLTNRAQDGTAPDRERLGELLPEYVEGGICPR